MADATPLYVVQENEQLLLRFGRCRACGASFFPPQHFGCEHCGAYGDSLESHLSTGAGKVLSAITVYKHRGPGPTAPFALATVLLDDGVELRGFLTEAGAAAGTRVKAVLVPEIEQGGLPPVRFQVLSNGGQP